MRDFSRVGPAEVSMKRGEVPNKHKHDAQVSEYKALDVSLAGASCLYCRKRQKLN